jgi:two-component system sensor kinase FixL
VTVTWIVIVWLMIAGACLAVGFIHAAVGMKGRAERAHSAFSVVAFSYAAIIVCELLLMHAQTPGQFAAIMRWTHVPVSIAMVSTIVFLRIYLRAGRSWLAYGILGLQLASLIVNFQSSANIDYRAISGLQVIELFRGGALPVPVGVRNPWAALNDLSLLLFLIFVAEAVATALRRRDAGERRRATVIGGSFLVMIVAAGAISLLLRGEIVPSSYLQGIPFLAVLVASSMELSADVFRAVGLAAELQKTAEQIRQERSFLRQVIDVAPNLIFAKNREGRFVLVNQAVADIYGTTVDALIGKTDADFDHDADEVKAFRRADLEVLNTLSEQHILEERITDANGKIHWLQTVKRPLVGDDGTANLVLGSATDITARKEIDLELARQRNELAHFSRLTVLGVLSGSIAHELNQPLSAILSNAQAGLRFLAADRLDLNEVREILHDIVRDDKRAGEVIHGLRLLLKKGETRQQPLDLNAMVRDVLRLVHSDILNGGVCLTTAFTTSTPEVQGDPVQLQQVLLNLVVNACDAMAGNATEDRRLHVAVESAPGNCVQVRVTDGGQGIPAADIERVFDPFISTKPNGLGLGLSVCRKIIQAHGGRLWAMNNAERGASFQFTLPTTSGGAA